MLEGAAGGGGGGGGVGGGGGEGGSGRKKHPSSCFCRYHFPVTGFLSVRESCSQGFLLLQRLQRPPEPSPVITLSPLSSLELFSSFAASP